ncbi:MAG: hypothetical protein GY715_01905 [Planctomycetes bacterium]|nr:hypothetical protein [Planctomycetota bacterium]
MAIRRLIVPVVLASLVAFIAGQAARPQQQQPQPQVGSVTWIEKSFRLPAVGNVDAVKTWKYGRIERMSRMGENDAILDIRFAEGGTRRVLCPHGPFVELARVSNWFQSGQAGPSGRDFVERMVALDFDADDRVVALVSLEPLPRNARRIADTFRR